VQALGNAFLGSIVGLFISLLISTTSTPRAPIKFTDPVTVFGVAIPLLIPLASVLLVVVVCVIAAYVPYWRIRRIDPACVLRGF
jgi:ABC-type antimicrobial peptide transport system permease subunit